MRIRDGIFALYLGFSLSMFAGCGMLNWETYAIGIPTVLMVININEKQ